MKSANRFFGDAAWGAVQVCWPHCQEPVDLSTLPKLSSHFAGKSASIFARPEDFKGATAGRAWVGTRGSALVSS